MATKFSYSSGGRGRKAGVKVNAWLVMMAAMMLPSVAPTVALYTQMTRRRSRLAPVAFVAGYLNVFLIARLGVARTLFALGAAYLVMMLAGARILRRPPDGWRPAGWTEPARAATHRVNFTRNAAVRTVQFWLLWGMLFVNVTAGIGILAQASPMMQDLFGKSALEAAAVVSLISVFNAGGRFLWASASDYLGRRNTYLIFFALQFGLFLAIPRLARGGDWLLFQAALFVIFTMYGGGFATIPAFLADLFGAANVGAIHGAVLTAWSAAAIAGPVLITELANRARTSGAARESLYDTPLQALAVLLAVGFVITSLVRPVPGPR